MRHPERNVFAVPGVLVYTMLFLLAAQLVVPALVPASLVYDYRLDYEYFRDNHANLDVAIREIGAEIRRERLTDYVVILGDSVAYSAPGGPEQSIGAVMEAIARTERKPLRVFNLAEPSMQVGDIYTVILKLHQAGIATPRLVINLLYGGFVARTPYPPVVFWLEEDLRRLDGEAYDRVRAHLDAARLDPAARPPATLAARFDRFVAGRLYPRFAPLAYRDFIRASLTRLVTGRNPTAEVRDTRPWTEKPQLPRLLEEWEYQQAFLDTPFIMDESNPQVYFLERIMARTAGDRVLFFLSPVNQVLMRTKVAKPGYQENLRRVEQYFASKPVAFLNLEQAIPDRYFADHMHLTPEGYRLLGESIWRSLDAPAAGNH